jgi:hypothetical protein
MPKYIPYSLRHNITDKDLAKLLDFLEREMWWEIKLKNNDAFTYIESKPYLLTLDPWGRVHLFKDRKTIPLLHDFHAPLFFRTYRTLLPTIRDLYSK